jgi:hypothetical protein
MEGTTMSLSEIRQRFSSPDSLRRVRNRSRLSAICLSVSALVYAVSLGMGDQIWHSFLIPTAVLLAANLAWIVYFQVDQKRAIYSLVDHIQKLEERIDSEEPAIQGVDG